MGLVGAVSLSDRHGSPEKNRKRRRFFPEESPVERGKRRKRPPPFSTRNLLLGRPRPSVPVPFPAQALGGVEEHQGVHRAYPEGYLSQMAVSQKTGTKMEPS